MTVDVFDTETFRLALPEGSFIRGIEYGEYTYQVPVDNQACVIVRSSIHADGVSAEAGQDSIRMWLNSVDGVDFLGKVTLYTTRVSGWESRMKKAIMKLIQLRSKAGDCPECDKPLHIFEVSKEGANKGRLFAKCMNCDSCFMWLDMPTAPYFSNKVKKSLLAALEQADKPTDADIPDELPEEAEMGVSSSPKQVVIMDYAANGEQLVAIMAPYGPLRVQAGPGSGKTFTIARRYEFMFKENFPSDQIVAVTFNVKMADELLRKIIQRVPEIEGTPAERQICTIHALCFRMLKGFYADWRKLQVAPDWWQKRTYTEILEKLFDADVRPAYEETRDVIHTSKSLGYTRETASGFYQNLLGDYYGEKMALVRESIDTALAENDYTTFDDQLLAVEVALDFDPEFKKYWQSKITAVIVDEAQDTSRQAMKILTTLVDHTKNIFIVGDTDQLLYRFAGATPEANLGEGFDKMYPEGQSFPLQTNYRSTQAIVYQSRAVIAFNYEIGGGPYDDRFLKDLRPTETAPEGIPIKFDEYHDAYAEALGVLGSVRELLSDGVHPDDIFVGFRTRAQAGYMEAAFSLADVPYLNTAGVSFWGLSHVQDILAYLRIVRDPDDAEAFKRIINIPSNWWTVPWKNHPDYGRYTNHRFLGRAFLEDTGGRYGHIKRFTSVYKYEPGINDILELVEEIRNTYSAEGLSSAIQYVIDNAYRKYVLYEVGGAENTTGEGQRVDDLSTVVEIARHFDSLNVFFDFVDKMVAQSKAQEKGDWSGRVVFSTIHRLKGLERDYVFGIGCSESPDGSDKVGGLLPHTFSLVPPPSEGKFDIYGKGRVEDERCLFYVLITRARKGVFLSSIIEYRKFQFGPSRFIQELGL